MMADRTKRIADGLAAAERSGHELELAKDRSAELLREAKRKAADIIGAANKRSTEIVEEAKDQGRAEGQRQIDAAGAEIIHETNHAKEELRKQFVQLTLASAAKILEREINPEVHGEFLGKMIKRL